jgi:hypothetical protein
MRRLDLSKRVFGELTVIEYAGINPHGKTTWRCSCSCGNPATVIVIGSQMLNGMTTSCGCRKNDGHANYRHGHKSKEGGSRAYLAWINMKARCHGAKEEWVKNYVNRGITYDPAWEEFPAFLADMGEPPEGLSLDRIDNDGPYRKANCRWANRMTQRHNSRGPWHYVTVKGERMLLVDAIKKYATVSRTVVQMRLGRGWPEEEAILTPKTKQWSRKSKRLT